MNNVHVEVEAEVNPTEDPEKVLTALNRVFGYLNYERRSEGDRVFIYGRGSGLSALQRFHDLLRREQILDAARTVMFRGLRDNVITFYLNKQVAFVGHISFSQPERESPLGPIKVKISCDNPRELIEWLTPKTR